MIPIGKAICIRRGQRRLSQQQLADDAGVSVGRLQDYEAGRLFPTLPTLDRIAWMLGMTSDHLIQMAEELERRCKMQEN